MTNSFYIEHRNDVYGERELNKLIVSFVLGDGGLWIAKDSRVNGNAQYHTSKLWKNLDYILMQSRVLSQVTKVYILQIPSKGMHKLSLRMNTMRHPKFTHIYRRIYATGRKALTYHDLIDFDSVSLANLIQDDGYINVTSPKHHRIGICTENFSEPECKLLRDVIADKLNVHSDLIRYKHKFRLQFNRKQTDKVFDIVQPYIAPSYYYKIRQTPSLETVASWYYNTIQDDGIVRTLLKDSDLYRNVIGDTVS
jgi:hypothetical protein